MKTRRILTLAVLTLFVLGSVAAYAQRGAGFGRGADRDDANFGRGERMGFAEKLDLTADQIKKMKDLHVDARKKTIPLTADLKLARLELREMIRDGASETAVDSKIDQISSIRSEIQKVRTRVHLSVVNMLTAEQKEKLETMPFGCGFGHGPGKHGSRGHGFRMMDGDCPMIGDVSPGSPPEDLLWDED